MPETVPVTLDVEPDVAAALADPATRERAARLVAEAVRAKCPPAPGPEDVLERMRALRARQTLGGLSIKELIEEGRR